MNSVSKLLGIVASECRFVIKRDNEVHGFSKVLKNEGKKKKTLDGLNLTSDFSKLGLARGSKGSR